MFAKLFSCALIGLESYVIEVEVDAHAGMPYLQIVGLPDAIIKESRERIWNALKYTGYRLPNKRITINLAPASLKKEGAFLDLPIAVGMLIATNQLVVENMDRYIIAGELALDGALRPISGSLSIAINAAKQGWKNIIVPAQNAAEASVIDTAHIYPMQTLEECLDFLQHPESKSPFKSSSIHVPEPYNKSIDFSDIKGQHFAKRAVEIACAGAHNLLMIGPPGSGKTMIAQRIPTILPPLTFDEMLETTQLYSISNLLTEDQQLIVERPFRSPHHTASDVAIVGGGSSPKPGEISLAHHGILFLDELTEFRSKVLQVLRQPLEDRKVTISRSERSVTYPSQIMFVGAMNPCECGYYGHPDIPCKCSPMKLQRYFTKISGPILDRIDIQVEVPKMKFQEMASDQPNEPSKDIYNRVVHARKIQLKRYEGLPFSYNAYMNRDAIERYCRMTDSIKKILQTAMEKLNYSARSFDKILKVARTIADMNQRDQLADTDVMEALQYRGLDRMMH